MYQKKAIANEGNNRIDVGGREKVAEDDERGRDKGMGAKPMKVTRPAIEAATVTIRVLLPKVGQDVHRRGFPKERNCGITE